MGLDDSRSCVHRSVASVRRESPQARTASPADSMFTAAFRSRSCMVWQYGHSHVLTSNVFLPVFLPHVWQI